MNKMKRAAVADILIRAVFFFAFPAAWISGFAGIKNLCEQVHSGKPIEMNAFLAVLILLVCFTVFCGRFFCGKACAFGTYGDALRWVTVHVAKKMKKRPPGIGDRYSVRLRYIKFAVLLCVCAACISGYGSTITAASPWASFSYLTSLKFSFENTLDFISLALFALCSAGMMIENRFFCRFLCPFGAVFSLLPVMPLSMARRKKSSCIKGCSACTSKCPAHLELPYLTEKGAGDTDICPDQYNYQFRMGECFECGKCANVCPKSNAGCPSMPGGTRGIVLDVIKAAVLAGLMWYLV